MINYEYMKTYTLDEAQTIVNKQIKKSVATLRRELRGAKTTSFALTLKAGAQKAYVSRPV